MEIRGRDLISGLPKTMQISSSEVRDALREPVNSIVDGIKSTLEKTPPELASDIMENGIMLTGGGALLKGLDKLVKEETGMPVKIAENPLDCLIGIVGMSIGRNGGSNPLGLNVGMTPFSTIESTINSGFTFVKSGFENIINFHKNAKKAETLEKENSKLQQEVIDLQNKLDDIQSLESLKASLNFIDEKYVAKTLSAKVVSKNDGNWYTTFVVSAGSKDGVKKDSIVMNGNGLVGIVYEVSDNYCKVISLLDTTSSVSFKLAKNSEFKGIITYGENIDEEADYRDNGLLQGYMFDSNYDVLPGDVVTTSGLGLYIHV